ncbi:MAG: FecR domain-containing protein [bacterium]|nr:FecR domain-containing protein [bacterium]
MEVEKRFAEENGYRDVYKHYMNIRDVMKRLPQCEPSADYHKKFAEKVKKLSKESSKVIVFPNKYFWRVGFVGVAAMLLLFAGMFLVNTKSDGISFPVITFIQGKAVISDESNLLEVASINRRISIGERLHTGAFSLVDCELKNKFKISLKENTSIYIDEISNGNQNATLVCRLEQGIILADVNKTKNNELPNFQVITDLVTVKVRGTQFMVQAEQTGDAKQVSVAVLDGEVEVSREIMTGRNKDVVQHETFTVKENQKMVFDTQGAVHRQKELSTDDFKTLSEVYDIGKRDVKINYQATPSAEQTPFRSDSYTK